MSIDENNPSNDIASIEIRLATHSDQTALRELFQEGVIEGQVPYNDTGADIDNLQEGYFNDEGSSAFWVAIHKDKVIGMIGVQKTADNSAEIRRLRVRKDHRRRGVGTRLLECALNCCREHGYLKIVLDVRIERGPAITMFEKFGFILSRSREIDGRKMLDFYLDLYREPQS